MAKIGVLTSTNRKGRVGKKVADWFITEAQKIPSSLEFELVDVAELPFLNEEIIPSAGQYNDESTKKWSETIKSYDGFVIVNAEYNHGFTGVIKNALDTVFSEWSRKVVGFVGYGSYGAESSIMALRGIISYLNMMPIRESVRITDADHAFDENGIPKADHIRGNMEKFIGELEWWANALIEARANTK